MPKFSLATLFWLILVAAIGCSFRLYHVKVQKDREVAAEHLLTVQKESKVKLAEFILEMQSSYEQSILTAHYFKTRMGHFIQKPDPNQFMINAYEIPEEFGGRMLRKPPFNWHWRIHVGDPKRFEVRFAAKKIPKTGFDVDPENFVVLTINPADPDYDGNMNYSPSVPINMDQPVQILMEVTADSGQTNSEQTNGAILVRWRLKQVAMAHPGSSLPFQGFRSARIKLPAEEMTWMTAQHQFGRKLSSGWRVDQELFDRTDHVFAIQSPLLLMRIRKQNEIAKNKFESIEEPTDGLMVWITERTSEVKYERDGIKVELPKLKASQQ